MLLFHYCYVVVTYAWIGYGHLILHMPSIDERTEQKMMNQCLCNVKINIADHYHVIQTSISSNEMIDRLDIYEYKSKRLVLIECICFYRQRVQQ